MKMEGVGIEKYTANARAMVQTDVEFISRFRELRDDAARITKINSYLPEQILLMPERWFHQFALFIRFIHYGAEVAAELNQDRLSSLIENLMAEAST